MAGFGVHREGNGNGLPARRREGRRSLLESEGGLISWLAERTESERPQRGRSQSSGRWPAMERAASRGSVGRDRVEPARRRPIVSLIMPTYNEEPRLERSCQELGERLAALGWGDDIEVLLVDDGSSDETAAEAHKALEHFPRARVLCLPWHSGKGAAVRLGVAAAQGDAIVFMDADLATDLESLPEGLEALREADVVIGSRAAPGAVVTGRSRLRSVLHRAFGSNARRFTGVPASDPQCGFKVFRSDAAKVLFPMSRVNGFGFDVEILLLAKKVGYRVIEVPVRWHAVDGSHVHVLRDPLIMLRDLVRVRYLYRRRSTPPRHAGPLAAAPAEPAGSAFDPAQRKSR